MARAQGGRPPAGAQHPRAWKVLERKPLTVGRAARIISLATLLVTLGGGLAIRLADGRDFHSIGDSLWWSVQTVTTVGYGDVVPTDTVGRLIATLVMLTGIAFLTVITATITSTFVEAARRRAEGATTETLAARLDEISRRLGTIEAAQASRGASHGESSH
jgi:voltage-gated potassium channel Kch